MRHYPYLDLCLSNPLMTRYEETDTSANSEDPDEMPQNFAFHKGLHCLLRQKLYSEKAIQYYLEVISCDPLIYTMEHLKFIV